jgi:hypothetical protein
VRPSRSGNCPRATPARIAASPTGSPSAGGPSSSTATPGIARYVTRAAIGGSGTASAATSVRMASRCRANAAGPRGLTKKCLENSLRRRRDTKPLCPPCLRGGAERILLSSQQVGED